MPIKVICKNCRYQFNQIVQILIRVYLKSSALYSIVLSKCLRTEKTQKQLLKWKHVFSKNIPLSFLKEPLILLNCRFNSFIFLCISSRGRHWPVPADEEALTTRRTLLRQHAQIFIIDILIFIM